MKAPKTGKIKEINNYNLNAVAKVLGAPTDKYGGIYLYRKLDEIVEKNDPLMEFYSTDKFKLKEAEVTVQNFPIYEIE